MTLSLANISNRKEVRTMTLWEKRDRAEILADKARALGFRQTGFLLRDSYGQQIFAEGKIAELLSAYRGGDLVSIDVLLNLGRTKVRVEEDRGA
jgi:hypothetical protein